MDEKMPPQQHRPDFEVVKARGRAECRPEEGSEEGEALLTGSTILSADDEEELVLKDDDARQS